MKLSEIRGEKAIATLAEIIEPIGSIFGDEEIRNAVQNDAPKTTVIKMILQKKPTEIISILAALDGVPVEKYECNILTLPAKILEVMNDEDLAGLFTSPGQTAEPK